MAEADVLGFFKLDGKVALVTGGSKGLGKSMAMGYAQAGAKVVICSRSAEDCDAVAKEIEAETGQECLGVAADVTEEAKVEGLFQEVENRFGRLDVLVNSAGINVRYLIEDFPADEFDQVMDINVKGTWLCCRAAAKVMKTQKSGSVINVGSTLSWVGLPQRTAYCSSKGAVMGMTRVLALEWAPFGVRCNALCPGPFLTEINIPLLDEPEKVAAVIGQTAFNRWGELPEIRGAALFLASEASSYVTGTSLLVDGGWTAQ